MGFARRIGDSPVLPTLFSPLSLARKLSGTRLTHDLHEHPTLVTGALEAITETVIRFAARSEEHTSELQSRSDLVCRLLLEKKKSRCLSTEAEEPDVPLLTALAIYLASLVC